VAAGYGSRGYCDADGGGAAAAAAGHVRGGAGDAPYAEGVSAWSIEEYERISKIRYKILNIKEYPAEESRLERAEAEIKAIKDALPRRMKGKNIAKIWATLICENIRGEEEYREIEIPYYFLSGLNELIDVSGKSEKDGLRVWQWGEYSFCNIDSCMTKEEAFLEVYHLLISAKTLPLFASTTSFVREKDKASELLSIPRAWIIKCLFELFKEDREKIEQLGELLRETCTEDQIRQLFSLPMEKEKAELEEKRVEKYEKELQEKDKAIA
jgi:hypothetical protein